MSDHNRSMYLSTNKPWGVRHSVLGVTAISWLGTDLLNNLEQKQDVLILILQTNK